MCRHIGYLGEKKSIYCILLDYKHSLLQMAFKPKEMENAILNADGFGIAWEHSNKIGVYKNNLPIWDF